MLPCKLHLIPYSLTPISTICVVFPPSLRQPKIKIRKPCFIPILKKGKASDNLSKISSILIYILNLCTCTYEGCVDINSGGDVEFELSSFMALNTLFAALGSYFNRVAGGKFKYKDQTIFSTTELQFTSTEKVSSSMRYSF